MGTDVIPYEPYHPHLGYTLFISMLAWGSIALYSQYFLGRHPRIRVALYALAIALPLGTEALAYLIFMARPAPETPLGYVLTHFHAKFIERLPIDSFLSPVVSELLIVLLASISLISLVRFVLGTRQLNRAVAHATPLASSTYSPILSHLLATTNMGGRSLPPILVCDFDVPLAFTTGILQPRIYIASTLLQLLTMDEAVTVLCHEWAHVMRRDILWNWLVRLLRDMLWFLPGSHLAWHSMLESQDEDCDMLAATMTHQPLALARALVKVAGASSHVKLPSMIGATTFALPSSAPRTRVEQMIRLYETKASPGRAVVLGAGMLSLGIVLLALLPPLLGS